MAVEHMQQETHPHCTYLRHMHTHPLTSQHIIQHIILHITLHTTDIYWRQTCFNTVAYSTVLHKHEDDVIVEHSDANLVLQIYNLERVFRVMRSKIVWTVSLLLLLLRAMPCTWGKCRSKVIATYA